jgi:hypothetical protein
MSLKEIKKRKIYMTVQNWLQAPVTNSEEAAQFDEANETDTKGNFSDFHSMP